MLNQTYYSNNVTLSGVITFATNDSYGLAATANYSQIGFSDRYFWKGHINNFYANTIASLNESGAPNFPNGLTSGGNAVIHSGNIGSQSVSYAESATSATNLLPENTPHYFRSASSGWQGGVYWGSAGSESMSFIVKNNDTRFQFIGNSDIGSWTSSTWQTVTPWFTITSGGSYINGNDVIHSGNIGSYTAGAANSVSWSNVTSKPFLLSTASYYNGTSGWQWNPRGANQTWLGGYSFYRHDWSGDTGDMAFYLSTSPPGCGGLGICMNIDGYISTLSQVYAENGMYVGSDRTLKKDIKHIPSEELDELFDISDHLLKQFTVKCTNKKSFGVIAQEVKKYIPEAIVNGDIENTTYTVSYDIVYAKLIASLINEIKKQRQEIEELKVKVC